MLVGVPVSIVFILLVCGAQAAMQVVNWEMAKTETETKKVPVYWKYMPAVINSILIILFGKIYKWLTYKLVVAENHRYESDFENSIANKTYMFQFINTYISNFVVICYNQNFASLSTNLLIVMIFKQVFINTLEYLQERIGVGRKIKKVEQLFETPLKKALYEEDELQVAHLKMHQMISRQMVMNPATQTLVFYYNEAII